MKTQFITREIRQHALADIRHAAAFSKMLGTLERAGWTPRQVQAVNRQARPQAGTTWALATIQLRELAADPARAGIAAAPVKL